MKKLILIITLFTVIGMHAFAQGYVLFEALQQSVWDEFTTPGMGTLVPGGDIEVTFLWALTGTPDPLGAGVATTGVFSTAGGWSTVSSMISSGWNIAEDAGSGNAEADAAVIGHSIRRGGFFYNDNTLSFPVVGTTGGDAFEFVVIGWDNLTGATTLEEGMADNVALGWSNEFEYTTGSTAGDTVLFFNESGINQFGVAPVPEPATLALAGLGGLSILLVRRRKN
jgi:hypothetical protein